ncbi:MAG: flagellar hook-associated protein FlgK [Lachnospiraceae bacterium]|nr:flagellar hook-associated protein FlgK [Lachnospiraceae bacterium]
MPLMGSLWIGTSGLQTSQNALNTTAHNLSNVDTEGYVRQQVQQGSKFYNTLSVNPNSVANQQYGLGVSYSAVKHIRDYFLDRTYREESGRAMFYQVSSETLEEAENLLGELNGEAFQTTMSNLWTSVQELSKDPTNTVTQGLMVQRAEEMIERAVNIYDSLCNYQDNLNMQIKQKVDLINEYGNQILELNDQIRNIESGGIEHANDLRDVRDSILDTLGELVNMTYTENIYGDVSVRIEGVDFVKGSMCYEIGMQVDETTGFYTPFWPMNAKYELLDNGTREYNIEGAEVFDLTKEISSDLETDIGGLKAMLLARGDHRADYTDIQKDYSAVEQSVIMNLQAEFDQMIHNVASKINEVLQNAAGGVRGDLVLSDGTTYSDVLYFESDPNGYLRKEDGQPIQMFAKITTDSYEKVTDPDGTVYWVYAEEDFALTDSLYTLSNIQIDRELKQAPALLGFRLEDGSEDMDTVNALVDAFTEEIYTLNPKVKKTTSFMDYYTDLVSQVANSGSVFNSIYENQLNTVEATENARQQIIGVSSDDELSAMIRYQNAYNASSRYINTVSQMLEHILNTLGI